MRTLQSRSGTGRICELAGARTVVLTTYRRDGSPVDAPVHLAIEDAQAFVLTFHRAGKIRRMRRNPSVEVAPCTARGRITGHR